MTYCRSDIQRWQVSAMEMVSTCNDTEINQKWKVQPHTQSEAFYVVMDKCLHRIRRSLQLQTKLLQLHNTCTVIVDAWIQQSAISTVSLQLHVWLLQMPNEVIKTQYNHFLSLPSIAVIHMMTFILMTEMEKHTHSIKTSYVKWFVQLFHNTSYIAKFCWNRFCSWAKFLQCITS